MSVFVQDSFTDTDGTELSLHTGETGATWAKHPDTAGTGHLTSGHYHRNAGVARYYASGTPGGATPADYDVEGELQWLTSTNVGIAIMGRMNTVAGLDCYELRHQAGTTNSWQMRKVVAGTFTVLGSNFSETLTANEARVYKLEMRGSTIKGYVAGVERWNVTDSSVTAAGRAGVGHTLNAGSATTGQVLRSITATDLAGGGTPQELASTGTVQVQGTAALQAAKPLAAAGEALVQGAAALSISKPLAATGEVLVQGSAFLGGAAELSASGTVQVQGSASLEVRKTLGASGTAQAQGAAEIRVERWLASSGVVGVTGGVVLEVVRALASTGEVLAQGEADLSVGRPIVGYLTARVALVPALSGSPRLVPALDGAVTLRPGG